METKDTRNTPTEEQQRPAQKKQPGHKPELKKASITNDTLIGFNTTSDGAGSS